MPESFQDLQRQIEDLRARLEALAGGQRAELERLRDATDALASKLSSLAAAAPSSSPPPPPLPWPEFVKGEPVPEEAVTVAAERLTDPAEPVERLPRPEPVTSRPMAVASPSMPVPPPPVVAEGSFELRFGRIWLVRLGIALLVTGGVLLGNYAYQNWIRDLPAIVRLAALYAGSLLLCGTGIFVGRRENLQRFGEVLLAGGLAFFYWCTFAAHHVPRLRVVESPVVAGVLLLGAAALMVGVSLRRDSRGTAVLGLLLASYSTMLQPLGWLSAGSNVVLAAAGVALTRRPGWAAPGIVSMAGTYASFLGWQIAGGLGSRPEDPAALWFLPPVWALFALPGVVGISRHFGGLTERARSLFASANNVAFFLLFSALWWQQQGGDDYWAVAAVFGAVLLALGALGRSRDAAGGVHVAQGLGALSLAMVLKLEGYHLALGFGGQTLALSLAFRRFGGRSELGFAALATALTLYFSLHPEGLSSAVPLWSRAVVALLLVAAAFPLRKGGDRFEFGSEMASAARASTALVFCGGALLAWYFATVHLAVEWRAPACSAAMLALSFFSLRHDPAQRLVESAWAALVFGFSAAMMIFPTGMAPPRWSPALAGGLSLAAHWFWVKRPHDPENVLFPRPEIGSWLTAILVAAAACKLMLTLQLPNAAQLAWFAAAALGIAALGRWAIPSRPLQCAAALLLPQLISGQLDLARSQILLQFLPVAAALGVLALAGSRTPGGILARVAAVLSWLIAWHEVVPRGWGDIVAVGGLLLALFTLRRRSWVLPESWVFLGVAASGILARAATVSWHPLEPPPPPHGGGVVAACLAMALLLPTPGPRHKSLRHALLLAACGLLTLWSTQQVVWRFDWKPVAILWTVLGFSLVSAGLWRKLAALRHAGFALLAISLVKLFAVDVWDFGAFIRVAAFLALGVALVVLGFFYNRFAEVLKKILEGDGK
jgi:hypothetical protein